MRGPIRTPKSSPSGKPTPEPTRRAVLCALGAAVLGRERVVAASLALPAWLQQARAAEGSRFALGVASGEPEPDRVVLWTRVVGPDLPPVLDVKWELATDERFTQMAASGTVQAQAQWAHSVHVQPSGLQAGRLYWYRFSTQGEQSITACTRTAPGLAQRSPLRFVIASCQRWDVGYFAAWRHVAREQPDVVMFLGDYIYETGSPPGRIRQHEGGYVKTLEQYRARYAQYKTDPDLQAAHATAPWIVTWDDHEVDNDYASLQGQRLQRGFAAQRAAAYQAWWEHMPLPMSMRPDLSVPGAALPVYRRLHWGALARIHVLDDRQYRDAQACPKPGRGGSNTVNVADCPQLLEPQRTLLGRAQEQWLSEGWDLKRPWNLVAQQTLMGRVSWTDPQGPAGGTYWTDGWDGYPQARARLLRTLAERQVRGAVVLGGDVHAHYVTDLKADYDDPRAAIVATEFCGTSITSEGLDNDRVQAMRAFNPHVLYARSDQRGYVSFDLDEKLLQARLMALDDVKSAGSGIQVAARFAVEAASPGAQAA